MKKLLIGLLAIGSFSTFARAMHVEDGDEFINIGNISKIKLLKTLNIKPNSSQTKLGNTNCWLTHDSVNYDRSLSAPREFTFTSVFTLVSSPNDIVGIKFTGLRSTDLIYCANKEYSRDVTVGDMKNYLNGVIELVLSEPVEMD